jgi:hypothetical protein
VGGTKKIASQKNKKRALQPQDEDDEEEEDVEFGDYVKYSRGN